MNKEKLVRNIKGLSSTEESKEIIDWIDKSEDNKRYYISLMNLINTYEVISDAEISSDYSKSGDYNKVIAKIKAQKRGRVSLLKRALPYAAAIILAFSLFLNLVQYLTPNEIEYIYNVPAAENLYCTFYTEPGVKGEVLLPDSSKVWLNSGSKITYPEQFNSKIREVKFEGEGYFEVKSNPNCPMEIITPKGMRIEVLGTTFHIKSYRNDDDEQATLFNGVIDVSRYKDGKQIVKSKEIKPRESVRFVDKEAILTHKADTLKKIAWKNGELIFDKTPMREVIKMLERWHGVEIGIENDSVLNNNFTGIFSTESIIQIMELLKFTSPIDYSINKNKILLKNRKII